MNTEDIFARAVIWALAQTERAEREGRPLTSAELTIAKRAGIIYPDRVRLLYNPVMPEPDDPELRKFAAQLNLVSQKFAGMTLGYCIFTREPEPSNRLMAHELRHVAQFEMHGGVTRVLPLYLEEVMRVGYTDATYELDAREFAAMIDP